jgi:hypothetical protein
MLETGLVQNATGDWIQWQKYLMWPMPFMSKAFKSSRFLGRPLVRGLIATSDV